MSDDWQPGDLALCVSTQNRLMADGAIAAAGKRLRRGALYTVASVLSHSIGLGRPGMYLELTEQPGQSAGAWRFRKIRPHTEDEEDRETIRLMRGAPVREPAA
jgi:hypothetical protein